VPLFALIGRDGPRGAELRRLHRPAHLAGVEPLAEAGRVVHAGPLLAEDGSPCGSLILFEARDLAEARAIAARDPYVVEGVFASHEVLETRRVLPR
jgi:uncharacterized protein YciI